MTDGAPGKVAYRKAAPRLKMEHRWTEEAATGLEQTTDYLFQNAPERTDPDRDSGLI